MIELVAATQFAARPSSSRSPPLRCAAFQASRSITGQPSKGRHRSICFVRVGSGTVGHISRAAASNVQDRRVIMTRSHCTLRSGIKSNRCFHALMAEQQSNGFVLAGVSIEEDFPYSVTKAMRRHIEPSVAEDQFFDLRAKSAAAFRFVRALAGKKKRGGC